MTDQGIVILISFVAALVMSWLVQPHFRNLGFLTEIVDHPGYRRSPREPVPRTGGMAIFISFFCTLFFLDQFVLQTPLRADKSYRTTGERPHPNATHIPTQRRAQLRTLYL